ncbi:MAG: hypothetical protein WCC06_01615 [Candidatus Aminicenantales bacterium]
MADPREGVFLRIYNPVVKYLEDQLLEADAAYVPGEEAVFTVVKQHPPNWGEQNWPELAWVYPEEIRLLASVALLVPEGYGTLAFAPDGAQLRLNIGNKELANLKIIHRIEQLAILTARKTYGNKVRYSLRRAETSGETFQRRLYNGIDTEDALLIRGLSCLLKSQHLLAIECRGFCEDAFINVQIAREGAIQLIRRIIKNSSGAPASYENAYEYIQQNFRKGEALAKYLREQYEKWIMAKHPECRWGIFWSPPLLADDFFETYEALVSIYRHIITGEPGGEGAAL